MDEAGQIVTIVVIAFIGVRGCHDVLDAVGGRNTAHFLRHVPGFRSVVHFGENVAMDVDHGKHSSLCGGEPQWLVNTLSDYLSAWN